MKPKFLRLHICEQCQFYILLTLEICVLQKSLTATKIKKTLQKKEKALEIATVMFLRQGIFVIEESRFPSTTTCSLNLHSVWLGKCAFVVTLIKFLSCESTKPSFVKKWALGLLSLLDANDILQLKLPLKLQLTHLQMCCPSHKISSPASNFLSNLLKSFNQSIVDKIYYIVCVILCRALHIWCILTLHHRKKYWFILFIK